MRIQSVVYVNLRLASGRNYKVEYSCNLCPKNSRLRPLGPWRQRTQHQWHLERCNANRQSSHSHAAPVRKGNYVQSSTAHELWTLLWTACLNLLNDCWMMSTHPRTPPACPWPAARYSSSAPTSGSSCRSCTRPRPGATLTRSSGKVHVSITINLYIRIV